MTTVTPSAAPPSLLAFSSRGPLSASLIEILEHHPVDPSADPVVSESLLALAARAEEAVGLSPDLLRDDDVQLALFLLYGLHYGSLGGVGDGWEWHPQLIAVRGVLERAFEQTLRAVVPQPDLPAGDRESVARALAELTAPTPGPSTSQFIARTATREQLVEFLVLRSVYTLREADPHSWAIPRLTGRAKAALVEIQSDEYGAGRPERMHAGIFAGTMRALGLDATYGTYVDNVPAITLASINTMSLFGLNRRLLGAVVGHLAAFEMTSAIPNRFYGNGFRRLGFGDDVTWYFDEHVEADAVHEQIAARDLAGSLAEDEPALLADILFGASASLVVDGLVGDHLLAAWTGGLSALRVPLPDGDVR
jgi:hypothetical protein